MSEYWKSTPSYWCKFCAIYVKDTTIERKNHESSGKHQGAIQRSLKDLHKNKARDEREKQRAKDEVTRLNGLVGEKGAPSTEKSTGPVERSAPKPPAPAPAPGPKVSTAAQRKAHAEQLAALGVALPDELKQEVTGVGGWQTVSERVIAPPSEDIKQEGEDGNPLAKGVHKRKVEDDEDEDKYEEGAPRRGAWGSKTKTYPGSKGGQNDEDLDALLSGVVKKKSEVKDEVKTEDATPDVKDEVRNEEETEAKVQDVPDIDAPAAPVKEEEETAAAPAVVFKKRKVKK